jgi:mannose-6-phosphate isomerase-like protein (cupin superfamily)
MRNALLMSLFVVAAAATSARGEGAPQAQPAPKPTTPPATTQKPAQPAPAPKPAAPAGQTPPPATTPAPVRRAPAAAATGRGGMAITVTDPSGATIPDVTVSAEGPTARNGETNASGQLNFPGLLGGVYRLKFEGDTVVSFEKEVTVRGGQVLAVDVMLSAAKKPVAAPPPAPVVAPPPTVVAAKTGPVGSPQLLNIPKVLEGDFVGKNPRRESLLACSGNTRSSMLQVNQPTPERMYSDADVVYYVIGGEGTMKLNGKEQRLSLNDFISIPRGGSHSFERRGNRMLILLSILGGEACDEGK